MGWVSLRKGLHRFLPSTTIQPRIVVEETLRRLDGNARICDVGAGGRKITPDTFTIDGFVAENTDLVCDVHHIELPDASFDCVFCTGTLEHVKVKTRLGSLRKLSGSPVLRGWFISKSPSCRGFMPIRKIIGAGLWRGYDCFVEIKGLKRSIPGCTLVLPVRSVGN